MVRGRDHVVSLSRVLYFCNGCEVLKPAVNVSQLLLILHYGLCRFRADYHTEQLYGNHLQYVVINVEKCFHIISLSFLDSG